MKFLLTDHLAGILFKVDTPVCHGIKQLIIKRNRLFFVGKGLTQSE